jgi:hypothetical protein
MLDLDAVRSSDAPTASGVTAAHELEVQITVEHVAEREPVHVMVPHDGETIPPRAQPSQRIYEGDGGRSASSPSPTPRRAGNDSRRMAATTDGTPAGSASSRPPRR